MAGRNALRRSRGGVYHQRTLLCVSVFRNCPRPLIVALLLRKRAFGARLHRNKHLWPTGIHNLVLGGVWGTLQSIIKSSTPAALYPPAPLFP